jgi:hypothetical protein
MFGTIISSCVETSTGNCKLHIIEHTVVWDHLVVDQVHHHMKIHPSAMNGTKMDVFVFFEIDGRHFFTNASRLEIIFDAASDFKPCSVIEILPVQNRRKSDVLCLDQQTFKNSPKIMGRNCNRININRHMKSFTVFTCVGYNGKRPWRFV